MWAASMVLANELLDLFFAEHGLIVRANHRLEMTLRHPYAQGFPIYAKCSGCAFHCIDFHINCTFDHRIKVTI